MLHVLERDKILKKSLDIGASLTGVADFTSLADSPSFKLLKKMGSAPGEVFRREMAEKSRFQWPGKAKSAIVIALHHPQNRPQLDWWDGQGGTKGNRILVRIRKQLADWIEKKFNFKCHRVPYLVENGGVFLKDAAVMAGLGCIGKNNMLVTPAFGPRIRLQALLLEKRLPPTGPIQFDPCDGCPEYCRKACPQAAFEYNGYSSVALGMLRLPGRNGCFSRQTCNIRMLHNLKGESFDKNFPSEPAGGGTNDNAMPVHYCRECELACPVGKNSRARKAPTAAPPGSDDTTTAGR
jgi:epoxyqueuosine reductase